MSRAREPCRQRAEVHEKGEVRVLCEPKGGLREIEVADTASASLQKTAKDFRALLCRGQSRSRSWEARARGCDRQAHRCKAMGNHRRWKARPEGDTFSCVLRPGN